MYGSQQQSQTAYQKTGPSMIPQTPIANPAPTVTPVDASAIKSYCKVSGHERQEIVFACYECSDTFCHLCLDQHRTHTLIYFKDMYLFSNYDDVVQMKSALAGSTTTTS